MIDSYVNYVNVFKELDNEDKKEEIIKNFKELVIALNEVNKRMNINDINLSIYDKMDSDEEFLMSLFTYSIVLKEEYAKILKVIMKNGGVM